MVAPITPLAAKPVAVVRHAHDVVSDKSDELGPRVQSLNDGIHCFEVFFISPPRDAGTAVAVKNELVTAPAGRRLGIFDS